MDSDQQVVNKKVSLFDTAQGRGGPKAVGGTPTFLGRAGPRGCILWVVYILGLVISGWVDYFISLHQGGYIAEGRRGPEAVGGRPIPPPEDGATV